MQAERSRWEEIRHQPNITNLFKYWVIIYISKNTLTDTGPKKVRCRTELKAKTLSEDQQNNWYFVFFKYKKYHFSPSGYLSLTSNFNFVPHCRAKKTSDR